MGLTLGQAAKQAGLSKPTLSKHIRNGKLTAKKNDDGVFDISEAELGRFIASRRVSTSEPATPAQGVEPVVVAGDVALAVEREKARQLQERLEEAKEALAAATARADAAQKRADDAMARVVGLIEGPKRSWWSRLVGKN